MATMVNLRHQRGGHIDLYLDGATIVAEHRFRDPQGNEWVAIETPTPAILASYPDGTVEIPMVPVPTPELPTLDEIRSSLKASIDTAAEIERRKYINAGSGQAMTYMQKAGEANRYLAASDPNAADYPLLSAEIGITAPTIGGVAAVDGAFIFWQQKGAAIEAARLGTKAAIDAAATAEEAPGGSWRGSVAVMGGDPA